MVDRSAIDLALGARNAEYILCPHTGEDGAAQDPIEGAVLLVQRDRPSDNDGDEHDG